MINTYDTRLTAQYQDQSKIPDMIHRYYHPASDSQPALIGIANPIDNLYQYLKQVSGMLQSAIVAESDADYKSYLVGRLHELVHVLYVIDKPDYMQARMEQSIEINTI